MASYAPEPTPSITKDRTALITGNFRTAPVMVLVKLKRVSQCASWKLGQAKRKGREERGGGRDLVSW